ncbi:MAG: beta-galactosidase, partial [Fimbriimonadaceae bacterium]|nr:beta-galactosidase [Fimbriimonadaceae bacterium]
RQPAEWEDRLVKAKAGGCNAIASYIPWLIHEPEPGRFEFGATDPACDIARFIDLTHRLGMHCIARPGPFCMAELLGEGIPGWVARDHPELKPVGWQAEPNPTDHLDLLHPAFLDAARDWYAAIMPILAPRLIQNGGPIIACQLDNEVGMLGWVTNSPDLTDANLDRFAEFLGVRADRYPFDLNSPAERNSRLRAPTDDFAARFHVDWRDWARRRNALYLNFLRETAESHGVRDIPFLINVHGTGSGRIYGFPIGLSQLSEAYRQSEGWVSGSDHYLDGFDRSSAPDLHLINNLMGASNRPETPLTSLEFAVGSQDYGETGGHRDDPQAAVMKAALSLVQGNRLLNWYLLAGGRNPKLAEAAGNGNGRVSFTGERHGFAAPIDPEGRLTPHFDALAEFAASLEPLRDRLADMDPDSDDLALGWVPDWWNTDFQHGPVMGGLVSELQRMREPLDRLNRALLWLGFRFQAVDLTRMMPEKKTLALASPQLMEEGLQVRLADWVKGGGRLFLVGDLPTRDLEGRACTRLLDALGVEAGGRLESRRGFHLSCVGAGPLAGSPEVRIPWGTPLAKVPAGSDVFLRLAETDQACAVALNHGRGRAVLLPLVHPWHRDLWKWCLDRLETRPGLRLEPPTDGVIGCSMSDAGGRLLLLLNTDRETKPLTVHIDGRSHPVQLEAGGYRLMPID